MNETISTLQQRFPGLAEASIRLGIEILQHQRIKEKKSPLSSDEILEHFSAFEDSAAIKNDWLMQVDPTVLEEILSNKKTTQ